jgi:hypothetical protein
LGTDFEIRDSDDTDAAAAADDDDDDDDDAAAADSVCRSFSSVWSGAATNARERSTAPPMLMHVPVGVKHV